MGSYRSQKYIGKTCVDQDLTKSIASQDIINYLVKL